MFSLYAKFHPFIAIVDNQEFICKSQTGSANRKMIFQI